jgi:DNA repair protein RadC
MKEISATVVFFDAGHRPLHIMQVDGEADRVTLLWRRTISFALTRDCRCILLLHIHTRGDPRPSDRDIIVTRAPGRILPRWTCVCAFI